MKKIILFILQTSICLICVIILSLTEAIIRFIESFIILSRYIISIIKESGITDIHKPK